MGDLLCVRPPLPSAQDGTGWPAGTPVSVRKRAYLPKGQNYSRQADAERERQEYITGETIRQKAGSQVAAWSMPATGFPKWLELTLGLGLHSPQEAFHIHHRPGMNGLPHPLGRIVYFDPELNGATVHFDHLGAGTHAPPYGGRR